MKQEGLIIRQPPKHIVLANTKEHLGIPSIWTVCLVLMSLIKFGQVMSHMFEQGLSGVISLWSLTCMHTVLSAGLGEIRTVS